MLLTATKGSQHKAKFIEDFFRININVKILQGGVKKIQKICTVGVTLDLLLNAFTSTIIQKEDRLNLYIYNSIKHQTDPPEEFAKKV